MPTGVRPPERDVWPPAPLQSQKSPTVAAQSRGSLGLLTRHFLIDFVLGLMLGPVIFFLLTFGFGIIAEWLIPTLPVPKPVQWADWILTTLGVVTLSVLLIRLCVYLVVGFVTTSLILVAIGFFLAFWL